jgi:hypothetical protein
VKQLYPEEQIRSRLRELTEETRRVREELRQMIRKTGGSESSSDKDIPKLKRRQQKS